MGSETPVIRTKTIIPRRRSEILSRLRLLSILENVIDLKLLILAAPAGYGKTSLLIDFAYHTQLPVCWFALDSLDNDPQRFIAHFISSITNQFPKFGIASNAALQNINQEKLDLDAVITAIVNDCYENIAEHFVFVLDDYHLVRDSKPIDTFINRISQEMPENCHLIIASRTLLTLPDLTLLVARSQVDGLSFEELAFQPEEIKQLMSVNYHQNISDEVAEELVKQTEGWITGLLLTAQISPKNTDDRERLERVSGIGLYEYLAQQVLDRQETEMKLFLLRSSLLEEFNAKLCERVLGESLHVTGVDWEKQLEIVQKDNLFVLPLEDEGIHLRYHHLFRDFLQNRMRTERPKETLLIEQSLAVYYVEIREWERALAIYSRVGTKSQKADLIREAAPSLILGGRLGTLSDWLAEISEEEKERRPELLSVMGAIAQLRGASKESLNLLDRAIVGLRKTKLQKELVAALIRRSSVNRYFGYYDLAMQDVNEALAICEPETSLMKLKAEALRVKGINYYTTGELKTAHSALLESLNQYRALNEPTDAAKVLLDLGVVKYALGHVKETEKCYQESLEFWQKTQNSLWQANLLNNLGGVQHLCGQYEVAAQTFDRAISYARLAVNPRIESFALTSLGDLYCDIQAYPEARQAYLLARSASEGLNELNLQTYLTLSEARLERYLGNYSKAHQLIKSVLQTTRKAGSKYEESLGLLEQCILDFNQGKEEGLIEKLEQLVTFFKKEGYHSEILKTGFYVHLVTLSVSKTNPSDLEFFNRSRTATSEVTQWSFLRYGFENLPQLLRLENNQQIQNGLLDFIRVVKEYGNKLGEIRKDLRRRSSVVEFAILKIVICALGRSQVKIGGQLVHLADWKTQSVRDLFFYFLQHSEGVTKEEIGEEFWPESDPNTLRLRFKNSIYRVRRALGSESIILVDEEYRFNRSIDYEYDVEYFLDEVKNAQTSKDREDQILHLKNAVKHYRGDFLPKLDYEWVLIQREKLHRSFLAAISNLVNLLIQTEEYQQAIYFSHYAVEIDPCHESSHRSAMLAYSALGDRANIARQYEKCKALLLNDLGVAPSKQTENLYKTLMQ
jgi:LuxR family maltose regulon positive regulatory protein